MAFQKRTVGTFSCPECGTSGPHNFKVEDRATMKKLVDREDAKPQPIDMRRFFICTNCGFEIEAGN